MHVDQPQTTPELDQFVSKLGDAATLGTWLAYDLKRKIEAGEIPDPNGKLLEQAVKVQRAAKASTNAYNALSKEEQRRYHTIDD